MLVPKNLRASSSYFKTLKDAQDASRLLQTLPEPQNAPILPFSPRMVGGKRSHPRPDEAGEQMSADNEVLTSPNPLSRAGNCAGRGQEGLWIALITPEIAVQKVQAQKKKSKLKYFREEKKKIEKKSPFAGWRASIYLPGSAAGAAPSSVLTGRDPLGQCQLSHFFFQPCLQLAHPVPGSPRLPVPLKGSH